MIEFKVAAKAADIGEDEDVVEVPIDGVIYKARRPTAAQVALLTVAQVEGDSFVETTFHMVAALLGEDALAHVKRLIWSRRLDFSDLMMGTDENPMGLIPLIIAEFAARPTVPSTDSAASPATGGRKSTRRAPGKGSTSSTSGSTDS